MAEQPRGIFAPEALTEPCLDQPKNNTPPGGTRPSTQVSPRSLSWVLRDPAAAVCERCAKPASVCPFYKGLWEAVSRCVLASRSGMARSARPVDRLQPPCNPGEPPRMVSERMLAISSSPSGRRNGAPRAIRTPDLQIRSPELDPPENNQDDRSQTKDKKKPEDKE